MYLCLFEDDQIDHLWPLTATRGVYDLRLGIRTLLQTTREAFPTAEDAFLHSRVAIGPITAHENKLPANRLSGDRDVLFVNGRFIAENGHALDRLRTVASQGESGRVFTKENTVVAAWAPNADSDLVARDAITRATFAELPEEDLADARFIEQLSDLISELDAALWRDCEARTSENEVVQQHTAAVHEAATLVAPEHIHAAAGCTVRPGVILNAEEGPIYLDENVLIEEGAVVRGPCYVGAQSIIKAHAFIEGSAFGYYCKVGGEVEHSVIHSLSNKAHSGFLGHSYLGRWCNLGADTNNSNLKNDYSNVSLYDRAEGDFVDTNRQFMGLVMGDHAKCGINSMFNTGTVVGVFCNLFGGSFMPRHVPDFSWGNADEMTSYHTGKALQVAEAVMARRDRQLSDAQRDLLQTIAKQRLEEEEK